MFISKAFAQSEEITEIAVATAEAPAATEAFMMNMLLIGVLIALFYLLMIRPQQKRMKKHQEMLSELGKGSRIVTQGGLIGEVVKVVDDHEMEIKVGDTKLNIMRSAVMSTYAEAVPQAATDTKAKK